MLLIKLIARQLYKTVITKVGKSDHVEKLDVMLRSGKDDGLFGWLDNVVQQMKQDGRLVIRTTLKKCQLYISKCHQQ